MSRIKINIYLSLCFLCASVVTQAQTLSQLVKAGDERFNEADYYAASVYYKDALKKDEDNAELNYKFAEASRMFNDYQGAAEAYKNVVKLDKANIYPLATFWLAEMLRGICPCKTEEALKQLKRFRNKYHKKDYYSAKAQQEAEACAWVLDHTQKVDSIQIEHLGKEVNTPNSEFNAVHVFPGKIQFSSLRNISADKKNEKYLVRIYNQPPTPENIFMPAGSDAELNIGNAAYSADTKRLYFTQCEQRDKVSTRCDIYVSKYENYKWGNAEKLDINDATATNTHPSPGYDLAGKEILYFSSDRKGGQGGMDIWYSALNTNGTYSKPVNAGTTINTPGNEVTPFYDGTTKKLFFSSDWHYGFGGYDIFETKGEYTSWTSPKNLLQPVNTAQNDLYYSIAADGSKAYITSNRIGSYYIEAETCCNDIYAYKTGRRVEKNPDTVTIAQVSKDERISVTQHTPDKKDSITTAAAGQNLPVRNPDTLSAAIAQQPVNPEPKKFIDDKIKRIKQKLPVALYFHNDEPDCCNLRDTTSLDYKATYEAYSSMQGTYRREYAKGLKGDEKVNAENQISSLFLQKVDKGFYDLVAFTSELYDLLKAGNKIDVTIKGFCSPLNYNQYNIKLGYRRVASLRNYFFHYRDGVLLPYIGSGALTLKNESFGEETAAKNISDNRLDKRNSVYNPLAATERRVEIISVELK